MDGIKAVDNSVNLQMAAALRKQGVEGSASEEASESQAERIRESQRQTAPSEEAIESSPERARELQPPKAPSVNGSGSQLNLLA